MLIMTYHLFESRFLFRIQAVMFEPASEWPNPCTVHKATWKISDKITFNYISIFLYEITFKWISQDYKHYLHSHGNKKGYLKGYFFLQHAKQNRTLRYDAIFRFLDNFKMASSIPRDYSLHFFNPQNASFILPNVSHQNSLLQPLFK